jgi:hypothetical protein
MYVAQCHSLKYLMGIKHRKKAKHFRTFCSREYQAYYEFCTGMKHSLKATLLQNFVLKFSEKRMFTFTKFP